MSALTGGRNTKQLGVNKVVLDDLEIQQATNTKIYEGAIVALSSTGYGTPGAAATTLTAAGVAILNPNAGNVSDSTGIADGVLKIRVRQGVFKFGNSTAGDAIAQAQCGTLCYIVDDQTVAKTSGSSTRSIAGIVMQVDTDGVWVAIGLQLQPNVSFASLQTQINAVINGNCEEISASGALSIVKRTSRLTVGGTLALTLADGTVAGQRKTIYCVSVSGTPVGVVTLAHGETGFTVITFGAASGKCSVELEWDSSATKWKLVGSVTTSGATLTFA